MTDQQRANTVKQLRHTRPRNRFVRVSLVIFLGLLTTAWLIGPLLQWTANTSATMIGKDLTFNVTQLSSQRSQANLQRFFKEITPWPVSRPDAPKRTATEKLSVGLRYYWDLFVTRGWTASLATLAIAVASILLAGIGALLLTLPAARNLATPEPLLPEGTPAPAWQVWPWRLVVGGTRAFLIFVRAVPEYIWAFLFLAMFGPKAWPAVLALAIHNMGILGKLNAEVVENIERQTPAALRGLGATRGQIAMVGLTPLLMPRFLLFFFYRWETCVREATVLGMLGFASLGLIIQDARARDHYDQMLFFILLGSALVLAGDLVSAWARKVVRDAE